MVRYIESWLLDCESIHRLSVLAPLTDRLWFHHTAVELEVVVADTSQVFMFIVDKLLVYLDFYEL